MRKKLTKLFTAILFFSLIIGFVSFNSINSSRKLTDRTKVLEKGDTIKKLDSIMKKTMLSSSKVLIIGDFNIPDLDIDSILLKKKKDSLRKIKTKKNGAK